MAKDPSLVWRQGRYSEHLAFLRSLDSGFDQAIAGLDALEIPHRTFGFQHAGIRNTDGVDYCDVPMNGASVTVPLSTALARYRRVMIDTVKSAIAGADVVIEIGAGHGTFISSLARENPDLRCIGADVADDSLASIQELARIAGLNNLSPSYFDLASPVLDFIPLGQAAVYVVSATLTYFSQIGDFLESAFARGPFRICVFEPMGYQIGQAPLSSRELLIKGGGRYEVWPALKALIDANFLRMERCEIDFTGWCMLHPNTYLQVATPNYSD